MAGCQQFFLTPFPLLRTPAIFPLHSIALHTRSPRPPFACHPHTPLLAPMQVGLVFQSGALFDSLTVGENVGFLLLEHSDLAEPRIHVRV